MLLYKGTCPIGSSNVMVSFLSLRLVTDIGASPRWFSFTHGIAAAVAVVARRPLTPRATHGVVPAQIRELRMAVPDQAWDLLASPHRMDRTHV